MPGFLQSSPRRLRHRLQSPRQGIPVTPGALRLLSPGALTMTGARRKGGMSTVRSIKLQSIEPIHVYIYIYIYIYQSCWCLMILGLSQSANPCVCIYIYFSNHPTPHSPFSTSKMMEKLGWNQLEFIRDFRMDLFKIYEADEDSTLWESHQWCLSHRSEMTMEVLHGHCVFVPPWPPTAKCPRTTHRNWSAHYYCCWIYPMF